MNFQDLMPYLFGSASGRNFNIDPTTMLAGGVFPGLLSQTNSTQNSSGVNGILSPSNINPMSIFQQNGNTNNLRNLLFLKYIFGGNNTDNLPSTLGAFGS